MDSRSIEEWMKKRGVTRAELAAMVGVNTSTLWRFMTGKSVGRSKTLGMAIMFAIQGYEAWYLANHDAPRPTPWQPERRLAAG
jgi:transcriptional regulator with XRE-family HTH domain